MQLAEAKTKTVETNLQLSESQEKFYLDTETRYLGYFCGYGAGKTFIGAHKAVWNIIQFPGSLGLIAANTSDQLNQSTLPVFLEVLESYGFIENENFVIHKRPPKDWGVKTRFLKHHKNIITFDNGTQVALRSLKNYGPIAGMNIAWAWIDEAYGAVWKAFDTVLTRTRRNRGQVKQRVFVTTTTNGFDWLYDYFEGNPVKTPHLKASRKWIQGSTYENIDNVGEEYIDDMLDRYTEEEAAQYVYGGFADINTARAYYAFDRKIHCSELVTYSHRLPVYLCCDFNYDPMSWLVCQPWNNVSGLVIDGKSARLQTNSLAVVDEISIKGARTDLAIREFKSRGYGNRPDNVTVFGDASGDFKKSTPSDYEYIRNAGFKRIWIPPVNPAVTDRISALNGKLLNAKGQIGIVINPTRCPELIKDLVMVGFVSGSRQLEKSKDPARTHMSDALGYCTHFLWPIRGGRVVKVQGRRY